MDEERVARNDDTFRRANERLADFVARELPPEEHELTAFICECADPACTQLLRLPLDAYREVRTNARRFLVAPGHQDEAGGAARTVEVRDGYVIVEKTGDAGELAAELA